ncbi:MAG: uroporphyrinogen decarboxylase [Spirochaetaceae bacterium]|jgi:uroporphyrinogen-III decarboxylase|nr:uroporphyrinogen decarboxylase [Spirochaetaceae bacterium]
MLSIRQNFLETIHGGKPDRFVKQYEAIPLLLWTDPITSPDPAHPLFPGGPRIQNAWGVTMEFVAGHPGPFPVHGKETVVKDITHWRDVVKMPRTDYPPEAWEAAIKAANAVNRNEVFCTYAFYGGVFETVHYLLGLDECLVNLIEKPDYIKEMVAYVVEYELKVAENVCKYMKPDALFHHDDWGTQKSLFMSPAMFDEFFLDAYKQIYGYYKSHGVEVVVHHSDSYAAPLVPRMIEMGVDVYQGCITQNDVPALIKQYGGKISFMGNLNNGVLDCEDWTPELIRSEVERACRECGKLYYIPCLTMGGPMSSYPGVYEAVSSEIDRMSKEMF